MRPKGDRPGDAPEPMIILTKSGMEIRFARVQQDPAITPERLAGIEEELKALRQSTAAIEKTLESHFEAIGSVRAALSQNEELVEGIVETLQMLNDVSDDLAEEPLAAAS
jgi:chromosome segregation ATPase